MTSYLLGGGAAGFLCHFPTTSESHGPDSMNGIEHNLVADAPNLTIEPVPPVVAPPPPPKLGALASVRVHWPEYLMEAGLLGAFMVSACVFGALYEFPRSPVRQPISSQLLRRLLM